MTRTFMSTTLLFAASLALTAQTSSRYDPAAEQVFRGTIKAVATFRAPDGSVGVHLDLKTPDGALTSVHVAPAMFIGEQNFWFFADDKIEIVGSRVSFDDNTAIWAKAIQKGSQILVLRNPDGTPKWTDQAADGIDGCGVNHVPLARATER